MIRSAVLVWIVTGVGFPFTALAQNAIVAGTVIDAKSGRPVSSMPVYLREEEKPGRIWDRILFWPGGDEKPNTHTDGQGRFRAEIRPGTYSLQFQGNLHGYSRYIVDDADSIRPDKAFTLAPGQVLEDVVLRLQPPARITGTVVDANRQPVPNATVYLLSRVSLFHTPVIVSERRTNSEGHFEFRSDGGTYIVGAEPPEDLVAPQRQGGDPSAYAMTYLPSVFDAGKAKLLDVEAGESLSGITIHLLTTQSLSLSGRVVGADRRGCSEVEVTPAPTRHDPSRGAPRSRRALPKDGSFFFSNLWPGLYSLVAHCSNFPWLVESIMSVDLHKSERVELEVLRKRALRLKFKLPAGRRLEDEGETLWVSVGEHSYAFDLNRQVDDDPTRAPPGTYFFEYTGPSNLYVKGVRLDGTLYNSRHITIPRLQEKQIERQNLAWSALQAEGPEKFPLFDPIDVEVQLEAAASIEIRPRPEDDPLSLNAVVLIGGGDEEWSIEAGVESDGRVVIRNVPSGVHRLLVWVDDNDPCSYRVPGMCAGMGESIKVENGARLIISAKAAGAP